ncbi:hypothetical protein RIVM261_013220 [Rivularia sp. IAM M-261]|nr:hypothetical protein RIVM261_013220 [Rivularia sp. IAM M-261]
MLLVWREIANINLTKQWQFTNFTSAALYRITHAVSANPSGTLRAAIGQSLESVVFDRRLIGFKAGSEEGHLFVKPSGISDRFLALQRLDDIPVTWTVKIEELIDLAESLPLPISQIAGLQTALDSKAQNPHQHTISDIAGLTASLAQKVETSDLTASEQLILAQVAIKAPLEHTHAVTDIAGLVELIQSMQPPTPIDFVTSQSIPSSPFQGLVWNELDTNERLVETWVYINARWQSLTKYSFDYWGPTSSIAGNVAYNIPFDSRYDYFFKDFLVHCIYSGSGTVDAATNYWRAIVTTQPQGTTFANTGPIPNDNLSKLFPINQIFVPQQGERVLLMYQKYGSPPGAKIGISLRYHLLRR